MPRAAKICTNDPNCPNPQPCPDHPKIAWAGSTRRSRLPSNWSVIRERILLRDPICKVCDNALSREVDHIDDPDDHSDEALQGICKPCHVKKSSKEGAVARARNRR